jgi:AraC-like DNA-binding protein
MDETDIIKNELFWTADTASREFGISRSTVFRRFKNANLIGRDDVRTSEVIKALFGDTYEEKIKLLRAQRRLAERKLKAFDGRVIDLERLEELINEVASEARNYLEDSHVTDDEFDQVLSVLNSIPSRIDDALKNARKAISSEPEVEPEEEDEE